MSKLSIAATLSIGTGACSTKYCEPSRPSSSPLKATKITERSPGRAANSRASSITAAVPDALSSAPLRIASPAFGSMREQRRRGRGGRSARRARRPGRAARDRCPAPGDHVLRRQLDRARRRAPAAAERAVNRCRKAAQVADSPGPTTEPQRWALGAAAPVARTGRRAAIGRLQARARRSGARRRPRRSRFRASPWRAPPAGRSPDTRCRAEALGAALAASAVAPPRASSVGATRPAGAQAAARTSGERGGVRGRTRRGGKGGGGGTWGGSS